MEEAITYWASSLENGQVYECWVSFKLRDTQSPICLRISESLSGNQATQAFEGKLQTEPQDVGWNRLCGFFRCNSRSLRLDLVGVKRENVESLNFGCDICPTTLLPGLSLIVRCKNEEKFLESVLRSIADLVDEVVFVDNASTDQSLEIAQECSQQMRNIRVFTYPLDVPKCGSKEHETALNKCCTREAGHDDPRQIRVPKSLWNDTCDFGNTLGQYYNYALRRASFTNVMKWDADSVAIRSSFESMIRAHGLRDRRDKFALWCTGETIFTDTATNIFWRKKNSYYEEHRVFSKEHGFCWMDWAWCEDACIDYTRTCERWERWAEPVFREVRPLEKILARCSIDQRDLQDQHIAQTIISHSPHPAVEIIDEKDLFYSK